ncbi:MAG: hypothetical protein ACUVUC_02395 [Thermoguttaceae bacterium]
MGSMRYYAAAGLVGVMLLAAAAPAQQRNLNIGYVYPAGGEQGSTFEAVIAGQFLAGVNKVYVSGSGVQATITELVRPMTGKEVNQLRIQLDELLARKAVVTKNFRALEQFRSFKTAKGKPGTAPDDSQIEALKKKYANATWTAEDEKLLLEVRRKIAMGIRRPANPAISELVVCQVTVAPDAAPGQRELRVASPQALSNPLVFFVGRLPEFAEKPSKSITQQTSAIARTAAVPTGGKREPDPEITLPATINGQILPGGVDRFRFQARKGQRLVAAASARRLIPYLADAVPGWFQATLALYDSQGRELAYADDFRFDPDPVLYCQIPEDGQYVLEIKDAIYRGREDFVYRITIGELPLVTGIFPLGGQAGDQTTVELQGWNLPVQKLSVDNRARQPGVYPLAPGKQDWICDRVLFQVDSLPEATEKEPNDQGSSAQAVRLPVIINGRIDRPGEVDVFLFEGRGGSQIVAEVYARRLNSPLDSLLELTDAAGRQLAANDDHEDKGAGLTTHHADSWLQATLPTDGTYYLRLADGQHKGGPEYAYRLRISPPRPDFELRVVPSGINAQAGATVPMTVYALRKDGFSGDIALELKDPPPGFALSGGVVPAGQDQVRLTLAVPPSGPEEPFSLRLEGRATIQGREVSHLAVPADDMMQAFFYRHLVPAQELKVAVAGRAGLRTPALRILGKTPVQIPAGGSARVLFGMPARRLAGQIRLELTDPPEGIAVKKVSSSGEGLEIVLESDAGKVKPGQKGNLILAAFARRGSAPTKTKPAAGQRGAPLATLPAVPFEIVKP